MYFFKVKKTLDRFKVNNKKISVSVVDFEEVNVNW